MGGLPVVVALAILMAASMMALAHLGERRRAERWNQRWSTYELQRKYKDQEQDR